MIETWREVELFPCYEASDLGRIRRSKQGGNNYIKVGRILKPQTAKNGYQFVNLFGEDGVKRVSVHRIVCSAFHGRPPTPYHEVGHTDGTRNNNAADNLRWCTRKENHADKKIHGTSQVGQKNGNAKLSDEQVREIYETPGKQVDLAKLYGISQTTIWRIKSNRHALVRN